MTLVEFFDGASIDNMASSLIVKPDKIIFIGENNPMQKHEKALRRFVKSCGINVLFDFEPINKDSVEQIISVLTKIVESEKACTFDLTGGDDLVLVAMGIVFEKYRNTGKIQMHRVNIRTGTVYDCDSDGILPETELPKLSVRDSILLYGGDVVPFDGEKGTYDWNFDDDFISDLKKMWKICKNNPGLWNSQIGTVAFAVKSYSGNKESLEFFAEKKRTEEAMKREKRKYSWVKGLIKAFYKEGFIYDLVDDAETVSFRFKNEQVKMCLTKEGTLLELIVLLYAFQAEEKDGTPKYNDIVNGVYIDWDATMHDESDKEKDTENEIDVVLMKGLIPIFISCKNGDVDETELYKLDTVAEKFGGPYAKKVLVATYLGKKTVTGHKYFAQRAKDMNIELIENVHTISDAEFAKRIRNIRW